MVNENKVALMTRMASFEKRHGKRDISIVNYYRGDYIGFQVLKAVIASTISFLACFSIYIFYNFEILLSDIYNMDFIEVGKKVLTIYLIITGVYAVIVYAVYTYRYSRAKKELKGFFLDLRALENMNSKNDR